MFILDQLMQVIMDVVILFVGIWIGIFFNRQFDKGEDLIEDWRQKEKEKEKEEKQSTTSSPVMENGITSPLQIVLKRENLDNEQFSLNQQKNQIAIYKPHQSVKKLPEQQIKLRTSFLNKKTRNDLILQQCDGKYFKIQKQQIITQYGKQAEQEINQFTKYKTHFMYNHGPLKSIGFSIQYFDNRENDTIISRYSTPFSIMLNGLCQNGKFQNLFKNRVKVGKGGFGQVYRGTNIIQERDYAIKRIFISQNSQQVRHKFMRQVNLMSDLSHKNIVRFYTCWIQNLNSQSANYLQNQFVCQNSIVPINRQVYKSGQSSYNFQRSRSSNGFQFQKQSSQKSKGKFMILNKLQQKNKYKKKRHKVVQPLSFYSLYIQMEYCVDGTLTNFILKKKKSIQRAQAFKIFQQVLQATYFLHSNGIVHRDLKPGNIFLNKKQGTIKIGDFGLSTLYKHQQTKQGIKYQQDYTNVIGTPLYMAPQIKQKCIGDPFLLDVYSMGIIYMEMLVKCKTNHQKLFKLSKAKCQSIPFKQQRDLIQRMICKASSRIQCRLIYQLQSYKQLQQIFKKIKLKL